MPRVTTRAEARAASAHSSWARSCAPADLEWMRITRRVPAALLMHKSEASHAAASSVASPRVARQAGMFDRTRTGCRALRSRHRREVDRCAQAQTKGALPRTQRHRLRRVFASKGAARTRRCARRVYSALPLVPVATPPFASVSSREVLQESPKLCRCSDTPGRRRAERKSARAPARPLRGRSPRRPTQ